MRSGSIEATELVIATDEDAIEAAGAPEDLEIHLLEPNSGSYFEVANVKGPAFAEVNLKAEKKYSGAELAADQFSFVLKNADGEAVETVKNAADGHITFRTLNFTEAGEYIYTISEVIGNEAGVTYDDTVYTITITVVETEEEELIAEIDTEEKELVFHNVYEEEEPEDPKDPEDPEDPEEPEDPKDPEDPEEPEDPKEPEDPEKPDDPKDPETPDNKDDKKPEEPKKNTTQTLTSRRTGTTQTGNAPRTGDESQTKIWMVLLAVFAAALAVLLLEKKKTSDKK